MVLRMTIEGPIGPSVGHKHFSKSRACGRITRVLKFADLSPKHRCRQILQVTTHHCACRSLNGTAVAYLVYGLNHSKPPSFGCNAPIENGCGLEVTNRITSRRTCEVVECCQSPKTPSSHHVRLPIGHPTISVRAPGNFNCQLN